MDDSRHRLTPNIHTPPMELLDHIGVTTPHLLQYGDLWARFKGYFALFILLTYLWQYQKLSAVCSIAAYLIPQTSESIKRLISYQFWNFCFYLMYVNGVEFAISGDELEGESSLVISNHQSLVDYIVMTYLAKVSVQDKDFKYSSSDSLLWTPRVNFFTWFSLWRMPSLKILFNMMQCDENWELEDSLNNSTLSKVFQKKSLEWVVLFPEINIFTPSNKFLQTRHSEKYFLPVFDNLLYPRFSALYNAVQYMHSTGDFKLTKLYDITISYQKIPRSKDQSMLQTDTPVTLIDIFASRHKIVINIHVKTRMITRIPLKRKKLEKWLEKVWLEKDKLLQKMQNLSSNESTFNPLALMLATPTQLASPMVSLCNDIENFILVSTQEN